MAASDDFDDPEKHDPRALLAQIRQKAEKLLDQLIAEEAELDRHPPAIGPDALVEGKAAMKQAIAAAGRTLAALDAAATIDLDPSDPKDPDDQPGPDPRWN